MSRRAPQDQDEERRWSEWMVHAQAGDQLAYEKLMTELGVAIERFVGRRFGHGVAGDLVEECVQESLLAVHKARQTYDPARPFRPWLLTLVRHKAIDLLRRDRDRRRRLLDTPDSSAREGRVFDDPSHELDAVTALEWLEPKYRSALVLTKLEGCSLEEAARRDGVSVSAMKTRVHRAIRSAQKHFLDEEAE